MLYDKLLVFFVGLILGRSAYWWIDHLTERAAHNVYAARLFSPVILQLLYATVLLIIYLNLNLGEFFLYGGFAYFLIVLTYTDALEATIDDRIILFGVVYSIAMQVYLGQGMPALIGGIAGAFVSGMLFVIGNYLFANDVRTDGNTVEDSVGLALPLAPAFTAAIIMGCTLPGGLANSLKQALQYIQTNYFILAGILLISFSGLLWVRKHKKTIPEGEDSLQYGSGQENEPALGAGDITLSVFLGVTLGWQDYIAVLWMAMMINSVIGVAILARSS